KESNMGQTEFNRKSISILSGSRYGVTGTRFSHPSCLSEDIAAQPPLAADLTEPAVPGWDNMWIDLGGEGREGGVISRFLGLKVTEGVGAWHRGWLLA